MQYLLLFFASISVYLYTSFLSDNGTVDASASYDNVGLDVLQIIKKYGYPLEVHENVETEDGYLLQLHRIPHGVKDNRGDRPVVMIFHCLLCSSAEFIYYGPDRSLGFILADSGFDVWLVNGRGNTWSRKHRVIDPKNDSFWDFSYHEMGLYDNTAVINYVLEKTNSKKLNVMGHSQGAGSLLITLSDRPEFNEKISQLILMAPACFYDGGNFTQLLAYSLWPKVKPLLDVFNVHEFLPKTKLLQSVANTFCRHNSWTLPVCLEFLYSIVGKNPDEFDKGSVPTIISSTPAGASIKQIEHILQNCLTGKFAPFQKNFDSKTLELDREYDLKNVKVPTSLYYALGDTFAGAKGAEKLATVLPNLQKFKRIGNEHFTHLDFLWAIHAKTLLYDDIVNQLNSFSNVINNDL